MTIASRRLHAGITTVALLASLVGGTFGIELAASHLSSVAAHSARSERAPASRIDREGSTDDHV
ncbi:MAG TPA: hypothetical protein VN796_10535 [Acidimicrobiales bacterium]|nr:hypothetical protein [Acidimicrobiales bacterium]